MTYDLNHKCAVCNFQLSEHRTVDRACPMGARHRVLGYTSYSKHHFFRPVLPRVSKEITNAVKGIIGEDFNDATLPIKREQDVHVLALYKAVRTMETENRILRAELKEAKKWKA